MNAERTNADEVVQALRVLCGADGKSCTGNCAPCPANQFRKEHPSEACDDGTMTAALNLIQSLTTDLTTKTALLNAAIAGQETLQKALAESQRREKAAVEMLAGIEDCLICMPNGAGCNDYGPCYRTRRGVGEGEKV